MYQIPDSQEERPGCLDVLRITQAVFAVVLPPVLVMLGILVLLMLTLMMFIRSPALALVPLALIVGAIFLFARWAQHHAGGDPPEY